MSQAGNAYFASYCRLDTVSEELVSDVKGERVAVGAELSLEVQDYVNQRGKDCVRGVVKNHLGEVMGFLPEQCSKAVCKTAREGSLVRLAVSAVGFTEATKVFWLEVALCAYDPDAPKGIEAFVEGCFKRVAAGERPNLSLSEKMYQAACEDESLYKRVKGSAYPKLPKGEAYYKRRRTASEGLVVNGSQRKPGCIVGTVVFYVVLVAVVAAVVYTLFIK